MLPSSHTISSQILRKCHLMSLPGLSPLKIKGLNFRNPEIIFRPTDRPTHFFLHSKVMRNEVICDRRLIELIEESEYSCKIVIYRLVSEINRGKIEFFFHKKI